MKRTKDKSRIIVALFIILAIFITFVSVNTNMPAYANELTIEQQSEILTNQTLPSDYSEINKSNITNYIPKILFLQVGDYNYEGKNYSFAISNIYVTTQNLRRYYDILTLIYTVETTIDQDTGRMDNTVKVIYQDRFLTSCNDTINIGDVLLSLIFDNFNPILVGNQLMDRQLMIGEINMSAEIYSGSGDVNNKAVPKEDNGGYFIATNAASNGEIKDTIGWSYIKDKGVSYAIDYITDKVQEIIPYIGGIMTVLEDFVFNTRYTGLYDNESFKTYSQTYGQQLSDYGVPLNRLTFNANKDNKVFLKEKGQYMRFSNVYIDEKCPSPTFINRASFKIYKKELLSNNVMNIKNNTNNYENNTIVVTSINDSSLNIDDNSEYSIANESMIISEGKTYNSFTFGLNNISFTPAKSGTYIFNFIHKNNNLKVNIDGVDYENLNEFYFVKNQRYKISFNGNELTNFFKLHDHLLKKNGTINDKYISDFFVSFKLEFLNDFTLGNNTLTEGYSRYCYVPQTLTATPLNLNLGANINNVDIIITDYNMNILNKGLRKNNTIIANHIFLAEHPYYIFIENKSGNVINNANFSITETPPLNAGYTIKNGAEFTYLFECKYTNNYIVNALNSDLVGIFSGTSKVQKYNNSYLLLAGEKYYFTLKGAGGTDNVSVNINGYNAYLDIPVITSSDHHSKINFTPFLTCNYNFDGKLYDIYQNNILLAKNVGSFYLQEDVNYSFIEKNYYNRFLIKPVYQNLLISQTITQINNGQNNLYKFTLTQQMRIDTPYVVMNTAFGQYSYDHGYFLTPGDYYLYVTAGKKDISIKEYDQTVNFEIDLSNETGIENNGQLTRIAGKYGKTVTIECKITKTGYSFNGWMDANGKLFTNANGKSDIINFDNGFKLRPSWVANQFFVKLSMSNNEIFYWDGVDIKNSTTTKVSYTTLMQQLVNISDKYRAHANGNKAGHLFTEMKVEEVLGSNPHFSLTPQWITEKYKLHFYIENKIVSIKEVPYGSSLNVSDLNTKKDYYSFKGWSLNGKLVSLSSIQDFTPGIGANNFNITLLPSHTPLNYELEIKYHDSSIKRTFTAETKISLSDITKSHVGYTTKMLLINGSNKNDITNNNEISGLAILLFYGANSYKIIEERALINYKITFDLNYGIWDGSSVANNIVQYNINKLPDLSLYKVKKSQAIFLNWQLNGTTVSSINNKNLGSYILKANFNTLKTNYGSGEINLTAPQILANITSSNATFNIKSTVNEVTFSGANVSTTYEKMQFYVSPRSTPLTIYFANITIKGKNNMSLIDASNCPNLTVDIFGTVKLTGGNFTWFDEKVEGIILLFIPMLPYHPVILTNGDVTISGVFDTNAKLDIIGGNGIGFFLQLIPSDVFLGFSGGTGIRCYNLTVSAKTVNVRGGNGSVGIGGIDGKDGVDNGGLKANKGESGVDGGNATSGKDGTMGGAGGYGIYIENNLKILPPSTFKSTAGNGGHGGDGGHGGNGGNGGKGGDGVFFGATAKSGGNGGNSGSGGNGGTGGLIGINRVLGTKIGNYSLLNGVAGNGGDGGLAGNIGYGGQGGKRTTGLYASNGYNGIRGRNGTDGTIGVLMPSS